MSVGCTCLHSHAVPHYREMSLSQRTSNRASSKFWAKIVASSGWTPKAEYLGTWPCYTWSLQIVNWGQPANHNWKMLPDTPVQVWNLPTTCSSLLSTPTQAPVPFKVLPDIDALFDFCWNNAVNIVQMFCLPSLILNSSRAAGSPSPIPHVLLSFSKPLPQA